MSRVVVYTTTYCAHCYRAKFLLSRRDIPYEEIDVTNDHPKRAWLVDATGRKTVPQIFIDGTPIGGASDLAQLDREGKLAHLSEPKTG